MRTAIQLYSLRGLDEPLSRTLERVADTGLEGAEFAGLGGESAVKLRATLDELGLSAAGAHVPIEAFEDDLFAQAGICRTLGTESLVVPILEASHFADAAAVEETAVLLDGFAASLADSPTGSDLRICYHNHELEFVRVDGRPAFERLVEATDIVEFELDVGWAYAAGADPVALLDTYGDRISRIHLKDVSVDPAADRGGYPVCLGEGDVPLDDCAVAARDASVDWTIFEHDAPENPISFLERAAEWSPN